MLPRINIFGEPLSADEIRQIRKQAGRAQETAFDTFMMIPFPVVDVAVAAVAGGIDHVVNGSARALLHDDQPATAWDWSTTQATQDYVEKVRASGRNLIKAEVDALESHIALEAGALYVAKLAQAAALDAVGSLLK